MTVQRYRKVMDLLARRQPDLTVLAEDVHKPHNLSAVLRSCDAVGIGVVHAVRPTGGVATFNATSASAERWVELRVHSAIEEAAAALQGAGMQLLAAHFSPQAVDFRAHDYTRPTAILLGNERDGVSPLAAGLADAHAVIPMFGMVPSLNVSVASAVILFEAQRQRLAAGLYDRPRLEPEELRRQAFRLLYPRQAAQLEARGQPFPALSEEGKPV